MIEIPNLPELTPAFFKNGLLWFSKNILSNPETFLGFMIIILLLAWLYMKPMLNLDDKAWHFASTILLSLLFLGLLLIANNSEIDNLVDSIMKFVTF